MSEYRTVNPVYVRAVEQRQDGVLIGFLHNHSPTDGPKERYLRQLLERRGLKAAAVGERGSIGTLEVRRVGCIVTTAEICELLQSDPDNIDLVLR